MRMSRGPHVRPPPNKEVYRERIRSSPLTPEGRETPKSNPARRSSSSNGVRRSAHGLPGGAPPLPLHRLVHGLGLGLGLRLLLVPPPPPPRRRRPRAAPAAAGPARAPALRRGACVASHYFVGGSCPDARGATSSWASPSLEGLRQGLKLCCCGRGVPVRAGGGGVEEAARHRRR